MVAYLLGRIPDTGQDLARCSRQCLAPDQSRRVSDTSRVQTEHSHCNACPFFVGQVWLIWLRVESQVADLCQVRPPSVETTRTDVVGVVWTTALPRFDDANVTN